MNAFLSDESEHSRAQAPSARKPSSRPQEKIYGFAMREAKGLFIWSLTAYTLRMGFSYLTALSLMRSEGERSGDPHNFCSLSGSHGADAILCGSGTNADASQVGVLGMVLEGSLTICTVLAGWALSILPSKVAKLTFSGDGSAPGFSFASTWILYPIRDHFGSIPNLPTRICETMMNRLTLRELAVILPVHFLVPSFTAYALHTCLPTSMSKHAIDPVIYSETNPWIVDFARETIINAIFTVGLLVIPEILKINGIRRGFALLILYPVYSFGTDAAGTASVFGPNVIYALRCVSKHEEVPLTQSSHMLGPIIGAILGGKIMLSAFPDDKM